MEIMRNYFHCLTNGSIFRYCFLQSFPKFRAYAIYIASNPDNECFFADSFITANYPENLYQL